MKLKDNVEGTSEGWEGGSVHMGSSERINIYHLELNCFKLKDNVEGTSERRGGGSAHMGSSERINIYHLELNCELFQTEGQR